MKKFLWLFAVVLFGLCYSQSRYISQTTKKIVYTRDGGVCQCCGSALRLEYDHIMPYSCGGKSDPSNIQLLCRKCNRSKSNGCYCKIHGRKMGVNCCDGSAPSVAPGSSSGSAVQCYGTTKKGKRCKKKTTNPSGRCPLHS